MEEALGVSMFEIHKKFREPYEQLLWFLANSSRRVLERNERTGKMISMVKHPVSFTLDMTERKLPVCGVRKMFPATAAAENAWYILATQDPAFIQKYAPIWDKFVEEIGFDYDDTVAPLMGIKAAYGYRWRKHFGRDQLHLAVEALRKNASDRRVWVTAWDPSADGLGAEGQMNVPCPIGYTFSIVDGRLNSSLFIRSSDVFVGLPYDVMGHALLMDAVAASLSVGSKRKVELGYMHVTLAHPHVYDVHFDMALEAFKGTISDDTFEMPGFTLAAIQEDPHGYVANIKLRAGGMKQPSYSCKPEVVA